MFVCISVNSILTTKPITFVALKFGTSVKSYWYPSKCTRKLILKILHFKGIQFMENYTGLCWLTKNYYISFIHCCHWIQKIK